MLSKTILFQSTFPRGERPISKSVMFPTFEFQSTFPRGERLTFRRNCLQIIPISIHVPAWGTTMATSLCDMGKRISIHVPAWGTTLVIKEQEAAGHISIHVPAWGTTAKTYKFSIYIYTFLYKLAFFAI